MTKWQPIETAPRANPTKPIELGPAILLWDGKSIGIAAEEIINKDTSIRWWRYQAGADQAAFGDCDPAPVCEHPTHWMPLPKPPTR